jgi:hypothetical protein
MFTPGNEAIVRSDSSIFGGLGSYVNDMSNRFELLVLSIRLQQGEWMGAHAPRDPPIGAYPSIR